MSALSPAKAHDRAPALLRWGLAAGTLVIAAALVASYFVFRRPLREAGVPADRAAIASFGASALPSSAPVQAVTTHFPDGSEVALIAGARGKLAGMSEHGARVILEDGRAIVGVAARPGAAWAIEAGAFSIVSTGGRLDVSYSQAEEALRLRVIEGSANVRGPSSPGGSEVRGGDVLIARQAELPRIERSVEPDDTTPLN